MLCYFLPFEAITLKQISWNLCPMIGYQSLQWLFSFSWKRTSAVPRPPSQQNGKQSSKMTPHFGEIQNQNSVDSVLNYLFSCVFLLVGKHYQEREMKKPAVSGSPWKEKVEIWCLKFNGWIYTVGSLFPDQGLTPWPLQWKCRILTAGLPGKSLFILYVYIKYIYVHIKYTCKFQRIVEDREAWHPWGPRELDMT